MQNVQIQMSLLAQLHARVTILNLYEDASKSSNLLIRLHIHCVYTLTYTYILYCLRIPVSKLIHFPVRYLQIPYK